MGDGWGRGRRPSKLSRSLQIVSYLASEIACENKEKKMHVQQAVHEEEEEDKDEVNVKKAVAATTAAGK